MKITLTRGKRACKIRIAGDMTIYHAAVMQGRLVEALATGRDLEVVLGEVTDFDSAGLQLLLALVRDTHALGHECRVTASSPSVLDVLQVCGLSALAA